MTLIQNAGGKKSFYLPNMVAAVQVNRDRGWETIAMFNSAVAADNYATRCHGESPAYQYRVLKFKGA
jgi:hypothetical protein